MPDTPDDVQRKIAALEALRPTLGDAAVDAAIAALAAPPPPPTTSGQAQVGGDNSGVQAGANTGTITQTNQTITNTAPNQGAQGTFNAPVTVKQPDITGSVTITGSDFSGSRDVRITGTQVGTPPAPAADDTADSPDAPERV